MNHNKRIKGRERRHENEMPTGRHIALVHERAAAAGPAASCSNSRTSPSGPGASILRPRAAAVIQIALLFAVAINACT